LWYKGPMSIIPAINVQQKIKSLEDKRQTFDDGMLWTKLSQDHTNPSNLRKILLMNLNVGVYTQITSTKLSSNKNFEKH